MLSNLIIYMALSSLYSSIKWFHLTGDVFRLAKCLRQDIIKNNLVTQVIGRLKLLGIITAEDPVNWLKFFWWNCFEPIYKD